MPTALARAKRIFTQPDFAGLLVSTVALGVGYSFVVPFMSLWGTREIGMTPSHFGLFMTATTLSALFVSTTLARWSDSHLARRTVLLIGASGGLLGYAGYALVRDPRALLALGMTVLALSAICFSQLFAHVRERFVARKLEGVPPTFLMSVVRVCFSIAWTAGPSVGAWVMVTQGFRALFLWAAGLFGVFLLGLLRFVPHEPRSAQTRAVVREPVWRVLTRGDVFAMFVAFLLVLAAHTINALNLPLYVTGELAGTGRQVGITFGIGPAAEVPLMLWFGLLAARGHQLALIRFGAAATAVYFLLLPLAHAPWHVWPMQILHGLSFAVISNVGILFFQELVPGQAGLATAIYTNASNLGNLVGYFLFGALAEPLGHRGLFFVSATLAIATTVIVIRYRPKPGVHHPHAEPLPVIDTPVA